MNRGEDGRLEKASLNLVSVYGPGGIWDLLTTVEFQVRSGAYFFNEQANDTRLSAVDCAGCQYPAALPPVAKWEPATKAKQEKLV